VAPGAAVSEPGRPVGCLVVIRTSFTELVGVEHPIVCAGMGGGHTGGELVGEVSEAGGLRVIGASFVPTAWPRDDQDLTAIFARAHDRGIRVMHMVPRVEAAAQAAEAGADATRRSSRADTIVTTVPDSLSGRDWPGASTRVLRTRFISDWLGREPELRRRREAVWETLDAAEESDPGLMWFGQAAGLVDSILPAGEVLRRIVTEAEEILRALPRP
jgi:NAD(P)H-dependent flavin oxidoreductase YrpB (nitropropane dioxygenase family)